MQVQNGVDIGRLTQQWTNVGGGGAATTLALPPGRQQPHQHDVLQDGSGGGEEGLKDYTRDISAPELASPSAHGSFTGADAQALQANLTNPAKAFGVEAALKNASQADGTTTLAQPGLPPEERLLARVMAPPPFVKGPEGATFASVARDFGVAESALKGAYTFSKAYPQVPLAAALAPAIAQMKPTPPPLPGEDEAAMSSYTLAMYAPEGDAAVQNLAKELGVTPQEAQFLLDDAGSYLIKGEGELPSPPALKAALPLIHKAKEEVAAQRATYAFAREVDYATGEIANLAQQLGVTPAEARDLLFSEGELPPPAAALKEALNEEARVFANPPPFDELGTFTAIASEKEGFGAFGQAVGQGVDLLAKQLKMPKEDVQRALIAAQEGGEALPAIKQLAQEIGHVVAREKRIHNVSTFAEQAFEADLNDLEGPTAEKVDALATKLNISPDAVRTLIREAHVQKAPPADPGMLGPVYSLTDTLEKEAVQYARATLSGELTPSGARTAFPQIYNNAFKKSIEVLGLSSRSVPLQFALEHPRLRGRLPLELQRAFHEVSAKTGDALAQFGIPKGWQPPPPDVSQATILYDSEFESAAMKEIGKGTITVEELPLLQAAHYLPSTVGTAPPKIAALARDLDAVIVPAVRRAVAAPPGWVPQPNARAFNALVAADYTVAVDREVDSRGLAAPEATLVHAALAGSTAPLPPHLAETVVAVKSAAAAATLQKNGPAAEQTPLPVAPQMNKVDSEPVHAVLHNGIKQGEEALEGLKKAVQASQRVKIDNIQKAEFGDYLLTVSLAICSLKQTITLMEQADVTAAKAMHEVSFEKRMNELTQLKRQIEEQRKMIEEMKNAQDSDDTKEGIGIAAIVTLVVLGTIIPFAQVLLIVAAALVITAAISAAISGGDFTMARIGEVTIAFITMDIGATLRLFGVEVPEWMDYVFMAISIIVEIIICIIFSILTAGAGTAAAIAAMSARIAAEVTVKAAVKAAVTAVQKAVMVAARTAAQAALKLTTREGLKQATAAAARACAQSLRYADDVMRQVSTAGKAMSNSAKALKAAEKAAHIALEASKEAATKLDDALKAAQKATKAADDIVEEGAKKAAQKAAAEADEAAKVAQKAADQATKNLDDAVAALNNAKKIAKADKATYFSSCRELGSAGWQVTKDGAKLAKETGKLAFDAVRQNGLKTTARKMSEGYKAARASAAAENAALKAGAKQTTSFSRSAWDAMKKVGAKAAEKAQDKIGDALTSVSNAWDSAKTLPGRAAKGAKELPGKVAKKVQELPDDIAAKIKGKADTYRKGQGAGRKAGGKVDEATEIGGAAAKTTGKAAQKAGSALDGFADDAARTSKNLDVGLDDLRDAAKQVGKDLGKKVEELIQDAGNLFRGNAKKAADGTDAVDNSSPVSKMKASQDAAENAMDYQKQAKAMNNMAAWMERIQNILSAASNVQQGRASIIQAQIDLRQADFIEKKAHFDAWYKEAEAFIATFEAVAKDMMSHLQELLDFLKLLGQQQGAFWSKLNGMTSKLANAV